MPARADTVDDEPARKESKQQNVSEFFAPPHTSHAKPAQKYEVIQIEDDEEDDDVSVEDQLPSRPSSSSRRLSGTLTQTNLKALERASGPPQSLLDTGTWQSSLVPEFISAGVPSPRKAPLPRKSPSPMKRRVEDVVTAAKTEVIVGHMSEFVCYFGWSLKSLMMDHGYCRILTRTTGHSLTT